MQSLVDLTRVCKLDYYMTLTLSENALECLNEGIVPSIFTCTSWADAACQSRKNFSTYFCIC